MTFALGVLVLACMDATTKHLAASYEVPLIVAVRSIVNCLLMLVVIMAREGTLNLLLSGPLLQERIGPSGWIAAAAGLVASGGLITLNQSKRSRSSST